MNLRWYVKRINDSAFEYGVDGTKIGLATSWLDAFNRLEEIRNVEEGATIHARIVC